MLKKKHCSLLEQKFTEQFSWYSLELIFTIAKKHCFLFEWNINELIEGVLGSSNIIPCCKDINFKPINLIPIIYSHECLIHFHMTVKLSKGKKSWDFAKKVEMISTKLAFLRIQSKVNKDFIFWNQIPNKKERMYKGKAILEHGSTAIEKKQSFLHWWKRLQKVIDWIDFRIVDTLQKKTVSFFRANFSTLRIHNEINEDFHLREQRKNA